MSAFDSGKYFFERFAVSRVHAPIEVIFLISIAFIQTDSQALYSHDCLGMSRTVKRTRHQFASVLHPFYMYCCWILGPLTTST